MSDFTSLPSDVKDRVFLELHNVGLLPFKLRLVSKTWNSLIVPIKFRSWEIIKFDESLDPAILRSRTWPDTWVYSKIKKYTKTLAVRKDVDGNVAGFLNSLKSITAIHVVPKHGYQGSLAFENIAEPIFSRWLPTYLIRLTSISLRRVKIIQFLELVQPKDIPRLKSFVTDGYCGEDHSCIPYRCIRASRMLVRFIAAYSIIQKVNVRLTDTDTDSKVDFAQALSSRKRQLRILSVRDLGLSTKPLSTRFNLGPQSLKMLATTCQSLTQLTIDVPAQLFFLGNKSCAISSGGIDPSITQWVHAVAGFQTVRQLYLHTYSFQTYQLHRDGVVSFHNHDERVEAAARELFTRLTFAKKGYLFDEMQIRYKVFRGKEAPPHSAPRKGISLVNCWLYKYTSRYYMQNGVRQGVSSVFSRETLGYDAWPEPR